MSSRARDPLVLAFAVLAASLPFARPALFHIGKTGVQLDDLLIGVVIVWSMVRILRSRADLGFRVDGLLNGYPIDYYDEYPERIARVEADRVREVVDEYVRDDRMTIVVVAPAERVKQQLERLGTVEVRPMPAQRPGVMPATRPTEPQPAAAPPAETPKPAA